MDLILEGNKFIKPKIKAKIVDKTIPKDVKIVICSNGSHDEPKNLRDYADNELDI